MPALTISQEITLTLKRRKRRTLEHDNLQTILYMYAFRLKYIMNIGSHAITATFHARSSDAHKDSLQHSLYILNGSRYKTNSIYRFINQSSESETAKPSVERGSLQTVTAKSLATAQTIKRRSHGNILWCRSKRRLCLWQVSFFSIDLK